jgi:hypothetical protein
VPPGTDIGPDNAHDWRSARGILKRTRPVGRGSEPGSRPDGRAIVAATARSLGDQIVEVGAGGDVTGSAAESVLGEALECTGSP